MIPVSDVSLDSVSIDIGDELSVTFSRSLSSMAGSGSLSSRSRVDGAGEEVADCGWGDGEQKDIWWKGKREEEERNEEEREKIESKSERGDTQQVIQGANRGEGT
jgi:hypothetical protein